MGVLSSVAFVPEAWAEIKAKAKIALGGLFDQGI
jgi:hypothetical protein